jgi:hypothetical protein
MEMASVLAQIREKPKDKDNVILIERRLGFKTWRCGN